MDVGVAPHSLPAEVARSLDEQGYALVDGLVSTTDLALITARVDELLASPIGQETEPGAKRSIAICSDPVLRTFWSIPAVLAAAAHVIRGPVGLPALAIREPEEGGGQQQLHRDLGAKPIPGMLATLYLDPFTTDNGATRLIPGSHRGPLIRPRSTTDDLSGQVLAVGGAGTVQFRDAFLLHAGTTNRSGRRRRAIWAFFRPTA